ncbi:MAG: outer membrane lipoprotein-sorting protein, partial [Treponema sp.]|nr:outer membrane lipoprotein-sorting protein [Treponema sp.]
VEHNDEALAAVVLCLRRCQEQRKHGGFLSEGWKLVVMMWRGTPSRSQNDVDKATYLPVKYENFNKAGKHVKTMVIEKAEPVQGEELYQLRRSVNVVNEETGRQTHIFVKDFTFDKKISPAYFTQQFLSTGKVN